jgi:hypothetical protein
MHVEGDQTLFFRKVLGTMGGIRLNLMAHFDGIAKIHQAAPVSPSIPFEPQLATVNASK